MTRRGHATGTTPWLRRGAAAQALLLAASSAAVRAAGAVASLSGTGAPAFPLSSALTPEQQLAAAVSTAGAAWPYTSGRATQDCPGCAANAPATPIWCASARIAAFLRAGSDTTQLGDAFVRLQPTATAAIAAVRTLGEGQAYTVDYRSAPDVLAGSNAWCAPRDARAGARARALRAGLRAGPPAARIVGGSVLPRARGCAFAWRSPCLARARRLLNYLNSTLPVECVPGARATRRTEPLSHGAQPPTGAPHSPAAAALAPRPARLGRTRHAPSAPR
jgi:hypothetical protein